MAKLLLLVLITLSKLCFGQSLSGLAPEDYNFLAYNKAKGTVTTNSLRNSGKRLDVPLDTYLPMVLDQGNQGACTAFAVTEALSIRRNYLDGQTRSNTDKMTLYSPSYLWTLGRQEKSMGIISCDTGISYSTAFLCLIKYNLVKWKDYPYPVDCHSSCPPSVLTKKITNKQFSFEEVKRDVDAYKNQLKLGNPICISAYIDDGYYSACERKDGIWSNKFVAQEEHAMVIVDYDDDKKCFKVLDSHGTQNGDNGFIWLSYNLVKGTENGVVFNAFTVSFENKLLAGPTKNISTPGAPFSKDMNVSGKYVDSSFIGTITDRNGHGLSGVSVTAQGTKIGTVTNLDGKFKLLVDPMATLNVSYTGYSAQQVKLGYEESESYPTGSIIKWTKPNYYRIFNGVRFGIVQIDKGKKTVVMSVRDDNTDLDLVNNFEIGLGEVVDVEVKGLHFNLKLEGIHNAGNFFNIKQRKAAFINYTLLNKVALVQYF
ncbi:CarboxypepD_reg-like domain-containing protein [Chitinophaga ginsengisegetis]|uniref:CarboxypepD_reg-like domain-containing protein n=1 Tax=Chitinophaga ginsengisegetis TaxID=393003 RepID=A0A1T5NAQ6_9BACT|nr:C1 family peptidase [Chitinophaga ginsengisegetis]SKC97575.1 CarboxypepD_reg-like domain-containing protein [Chitinophaga ginsengisegetis]